jgi:hypothetical protein
VIAILEFDGKNIRGTARLKRMEILKQQIVNAIEKHKD